MTDTRKLEALREQFRELREEEDRLLEEMRPIKEELRKTAIAIAEHLPDYP